MILKNNRASLPCCVPHFVSISELRLSNSPETPTWGQNRFFSPMWPWNLMGDLKNQRPPLLCYAKLCASFRSHWWIQIGVTVRKRQIGVKIGDFFVPCDLEIWRMALKKSRAQLLCHIKLCASFHCHVWFQIVAMVRKRLNWFLTSVTFDVWPLILTVCSCQW